MLQRIYKINQGIRWGVCNRHWLFCFNVRFILLASRARAIMSLVLLLDVGCWMLLHIWLQWGEEIVHFPTEGLRHSFSASGEISPKQRSATSILFHSHADENYRTCVSNWFMDMWTRGENQTNGQHMFFIYHQQEWKMSSSSPQLTPCVALSGSIWNGLRLLHTAEEQESREQVFSKLWLWVRTGLTQLSLAGV